MCRGALLLLGRDTGKSKQLWLSVLRKSNGRTLFFHQFSSQHPFKHFWTRRFVKHCITFVLQIQYFKPVGKHALLYLPKPTCFVQIPSDLLVTFPLLCDSVVKKSRDALVIFAFLAVIWSYFYYMPHSVVLSLITQSMLTCDRRGKIIQNSWLKSAYLRLV